MDVVRTGGMKGRLGKMGLSGILETVYRRGGLGEELPGKRWPWPNDGSTFITVMLKISIFMLQIPNEEKSSTVLAGGDECPKDPSTIIATATLLKV